VPGGFLWARPQVRPLRAPRSFATWSGVHRARPARWHTPSSEDEIASILVDAARRGARVRPVGSGHSWSDIAVPADEAIELSRMRRVLAIDAAARTIRVQAGICLEEITEALDAVGMALPVLGSIGKQTIAGAISTGTHGSSLAHGNLASLVVAMRLVTARGDVLPLDASHPLLPAARVSLGALGVISEVTLCAVPAFRLEEELDPRPIEAVWSDLRAVAESAEFVKVWWLPTTRRAQVFRYRRTVLPGRDRPIARWLDEKLVNQVIFEGALRLGGRYPRITPWINSAMVRTYFRRGRRIARSDRCFHVAMPPTHRETEYAFDLAEAAGALREIDAAIRRERWIVNFPMEIRFVPRDDAWMSPAYGRDTAQIGFYQAESPHLPAYFARAEEIAVRFGARPHWGKEFAMTREQVLAAYPRSGEFLALRRELDPEGVLGNAFTDRVLGRL
jgi:L-gulonolactone oxidase